MINDLVKENERVDDLQNGYYIIQDPRKFCFGMDAVLLSGFARVKKGEKVLDMGTGTGIIPVLLASKTVGEHFTGLEIQEECAEMAARSVKYNNLEDRVSIRQGDIKEAVSIFGAASFHVVTCNPPYKINNTGAKNDSEAVSIARHEMLCTIDDVCRCAKKNLKFGGRLCICNRPERLCDIMTAMRANGIEPKRLRTVHKNPECPPWLILVEGKKGGKPFVQIEKPLYVRSADGGNSAEMKRIYGLP